MRVLGYDLRWVNLTLLLIPLSIVLTTVYPDSYRSIYIPVVWGLCAIVFFANFPTIVILSHSRPIYYNDLVIQGYNETSIESLNLYDDAFCQKYQKIFLWASTLTSGIMVGLTAALWFHKEGIYLEEAGLVNSVTVIGIIGGILRIYYGSTTAIGKVIMVILEYLKNQEQLSQQRVPDLTEVHISTSAADTMAVADRDLTERDAAQMDLRILAMPSRSVSDTPTVCLKRRARVNLPL